ncbi:hypothetical protein [Nostoc sp. LPT]|uniref:hypothetical protein n=1 Tax=Nostoc sp. LPT TaxID=2815387 RepID=UPI001D3CFE0C|nr:hypothetical protein [Nostoc sp. LPT]MBN4003576.1 hypothetical protein [Nostoc sp. LPT]
MIASDNSTTGHLTIGSSHYIDFALWVLVQDGLQVPPFDKHTDGNQILQSLGMTPKSWYEWLKLILIRYDNRLCWHVPNIDTQAKENTESFKNLIDIASVAHHAQHDWDEYKFNKYSNEFIESAISTPQIVGCARKPSNPRASTNISCRLPV